MSSEKKPKSPRLPPRWFIRTAWCVHRGLYRVFRGRIGLWRPDDEADKWGTLRLTTTGRRTGRQRSVIVGYFEDGPNLVTLAMNGWGAAEPAWWLNLLADPDATLELVDGTRLVRARAATGDERERLWSRWREVTEHLDTFAARRPSETAVVVLEPRPADTADGGSGGGSEGRPEGRSEGRSEGGLDGGSGGGSAPGPAA
ncbi:nitroreductase/quinone reductase family protein [Streptodolium elevatio]|uniref:Nitroreductase/quinone reductase family protein n=1 Tax=Streptodolium elevatio TaxID=3157996 RepID=A0ABV3DJI7_9ACTN